MHEPPTVTLLEHDEECTRSAASAEPTSSCTCASSNARRLRRHRALYRRVATLSSWFR